MTFRAGVDGVGTLLAHLPAHPSAHFRFVVTFCATEIPVDALREFALLRRLLP
ncbi:MAG: hypothetical protein M3R15_34130 [Acidobacteriota bacterium]|nr:hypothetical protein [Acidobacteriota bacterium]